MSHAADVIIMILLTLLGLVLQVIGFIDGLLGSALTAAGVPPHAQVILLAVAAVALGLLALQLLGRLVAALLVILFVLLLLHPHMPAAWQHAGAGTTLDVPGPHATL